MHANIPTAAINDHWFNDGSTQTIGIVNEIIIAPTTPVNNKVNSGLSDELSFLVKNKKNP